MTGRLSFLRQPLNLRIAVLGLLGLLALALSWSDLALTKQGLLPGFGVDRGQPAGFVLLPTTMPGQWQPKARWIYPKGARMHERHQEYGVWERDGVRVTLSYDHYIAEHNALSCFLGMGQVVESMRTLRLPTADGAAVFNVARLRDGVMDKEAVATRCDLAACRAYAPAPVWRDLLRAAYWQKWWGTTERNKQGIAVNLHAVAISATPPLGDDALKAALTDFIAVLDLTPARAMGK